MARRPAVPDCLGGHLSIQETQSELPDGAGNCVINSQMMGGPPPVRSNTIAAHAVIDLLVVAGNLKVLLLAALALSSATGPEAG